MHVSSFDTNSGDWSHQQLETSKKLGLELALDWLCEDNKCHQDNSTPPRGLLSYRIGNSQVVMVSAWTDGRQWFRILDVFTEIKLSDDKLARLLSENDVEKDVGNDDRWWLS